MEITDIKKTKKERYALFNSDGFLFSIDGETLLKNGLLIGSKISDLELNLLKENSDIRKAKDAALRYLSLRAYGEQELFYKLLQNFDEHTSAAALAEMCQLGLICDESFAAEKAKGMFERGKSSREITQKLISLGINKNLAQNVVQELNIDSFSLALKLIKKSYMDKLEKNEKQKVVAALARRGFSYQDISKAISYALENMEAP